MANNKTYSYYRNIDRSNGKKIYLTQDELYTIEKEDSDLVSKALSKNGKLEKIIDNKLARLIAVSWYCLGGNMPIHTKASGITFENSEEKETYTSLFKLNVIKQLKGFKREKGSWTKYATFAKGHAIQATLRARKKEINHIKKLKILKSVIDI